jgi:hypothetical protein
MMSKDNQREPDPDIVERMREYHRREMELEVVYQRLDMQFAKLSSQWHEAERRGDKNECEEIERQMHELAKVRRSARMRDNDE